MIHCCEESFFEMFWVQQVQKIVRCLLHDLSNCLTGNLALSELYCAKEQELPSEKFIAIRDNCYKEREILKQLSQLHHTCPGNVAYIDLRSFVEDLRPLFMRLLPPCAKFNLDNENFSEILIKFDVAFLQRIFLLTILLATEIFENTPAPELNIHLLGDIDRIVCSVKCNTVLGLQVEDLIEIKADNLSLAQVGGPMVRFYMEKYHGSFLYSVTPDGYSSINLTFPIVK